MAEEEPLSEAHIARDPVHHDAVHHQVGLAPQDGLPGGAGEDGDEPEEQVDAGNDGQDDEPEPQEDVDLLVDDVDGEDAEAVELLDGAGGAVRVECAFGHFGED